MIFSIVAVDGAKKGYSVMRGLCSVAAAAVVMRACAALIDYRFFFTGDSDGILVSQPTMAYLFAVSDLTAAQSYKRIISQGGVESLEAFASGIVSRWGGHPFFDFNPDEEVWNQVLLWAVVQEGGCQMGWSSDMYKGYCGPLQPANTVGYERNPETDEMKEFVAMWTDDAIDIHPFHQFRSRVRAC